MLAKLRERLSVIKDARVLVIQPPPVQGLGSAGGFKMMLGDREGLGSEALMKAANAPTAAANKDPTLAGVFTLFNAGSPSVYADIDRVKAEKVGVPVVNPIRLTIEAESRNLSVLWKLAALSGRR